MVDLAVASTANAHIAIQQEIAGNNRWGIRATTNKTLKKKETEYKRFVAIKPIWVDFVLRSKQFLLQVFKDIRINGNIRIFYFQIVVVYEAIALSWITDYCLRLLQQLNAINSLFIKTVIVFEASILNFTK